MYQGNQQFSSRLVITSVDTSQIVYNAKVTSFRLSFKLPAHTLNNGKKYTAEIIVYDIDDNPSPTSDKILFRTFTTPLFKINNLETNQIVKASNYEVSVTYSQPEGELLNDFKVILYDLSHQIVQQSGSIFPANGMTFTLTSLIDNNGYYLKLTGTTVIQQLPAKAGRLIND